MILFLCFFQMMKKARYGDQKAHKMRLKTVFNEAIKLAEKEYGIRRTAKAWQKNFTIFKQEYSLSQNSELLDVMVTMMICTTGQSSLQKCTIWKMERLAMILQHTTQQTTEAHGWISRNLLRKRELSSPETMLLRNLSGIKMKPTPLS